MGKEAEWTNDRLTTLECAHFLLLFLSRSDTHAGPITIGHSEYSLCGLAVHPTKSEYATVGDDKTVRIWDVPTKSLVSTHAEVLRECDNCLHLAFNMAIL